MGLIYQHGYTVPLHNNKADQAVPVICVGTSTSATKPSAVTGVATVTVEVSKNGAAFAAANDGTWAEGSDGLYTVTLDADDTDTIGTLMVRVVKAGTIAESWVFCTVGIDPAEQVGISTRIRRIYK